MGWMTGVRLPARVGIVFTTASIPALGPTQSHIQRVRGGSFPGDKVAWSWSWHSPLSSTKIKNAWSYTIALPYVFMEWYLVKHGDKYSFTFYTCSHLKRHIRLRTREVGTCSRIYGMITNDVGDYINLLVKTAHIICNCKIDSIACGNWRSHFMNVYSFLFRDLQLLIQTGRGREMSKVGRW